MQFAHGLGHDPVLARHIVDIRQPLLHLGQALGVDFDAVDMALDLAAGFAQLDGGGIQQFPGAGGRLRGLGV